MNNFKPFYFLAVLLILITVLLSSFKIPKTNNNFESNRMLQDTVKWVAPASADELINPYDSNSENLTTAGLIYKKHCRSCHGRKGDGHGVEAADLETVVPDFTKPAFVQQTDGSMFWKISEGRNDMETFKKKLDEEDIWLVIFYIKTFSAEPKE
jgi:mono/diheme cytochrome c family protein